MNWDTYISLIKREDKKLLKKKNDNNKEKKNKKWQIFFYYFSGITSSGVLIKDIPYQRRGKKLKNANGVSE